ncbi:hypothetical protein [Chitinivorax sp. B]|uniref:hypothetical protein n=1 Tax=Chitinivorax sp. B TaxID=2502235 RepID=UPI0010F6A98F|nr:hypothetical protein [Chitinivorax sp. B]
MSQEMVAVMARLISSRDQNEYSCDCTSSAVKPVQAPIGVDCNLTLRALAMALNRDPGCLAADLLTAALQDAQSLLPADVAVATEHAKQAILKTQLPENQPGTEFVAGGT